MDQNVTLQDIEKLTPIWFENGRGTGEKMELYRSCHIITWGNKNHPGIRLWHIKHNLGDNSRLWIRHIFPDHYSISDMRFHSIDQAKKQADQWYDVRYIYSHEKPARVTMKALGEMVDRLNQIKPLSKNHAGEVFARYGIKQYGSESPYYYALVRYAPFSSGYWPVSSNMTAGDLWDFLQGMINSLAG